MGWCSLILVLVVLMHHGTLKTTPLDDLTINDAPNVGPTVESPGIESEEWKTAKTSTKGPSSPKKRSKSHGGQMNTKRNRILGYGAIPYKKSVEENGEPDWQNWIASLQVKMIGKPTTSLCGGVLISDQHILTAFHCIFDFKKGCCGDVVSKDRVKIHFDPRATHFVFSAKAGAKEIFDPIAFFYLKNILRRPRLLNNYKDDIAVIKLNDTVHQHGLRYLQISTRPGLEFRSTDQVWIPTPEDGQYWIAGWGQWQEVPDTVSPILRHSNHTHGIPCLASVETQLDKIMCFQKTTTSSTACPGDSGSPGVILIGGEWHVQGIASRIYNVDGQKGNCSVHPQIISYYVDVYQYSDQIAKWIDYTGPSCPSCLRGEPDGKKFLAFKQNSPAEPYWEKWTASLKIIISDLELRTCGGVLISNKHILTALHCVTDGSRDLYPLDRIEIYFDPESLEIWQGTQFQAAEYFYTNKPSKHEYLPNTDQKMLIDDIVVIKLDRKIEDDDCLLPIPISTEPLTDKKYWMFYTDKLPTMACPDLQDTNICFQRTNQDGICHGDAGAPGVVSINDVWHLQGIHIGAHKIPPHKTSECSEPESISVDIDISKYREHIVQWIKQKK